MRNGILKNNRPAMFFVLAAGFIIGAYFILSSKIGLSSADIASKIQQFVTGQTVPSQNEKVSTGTDPLSPDSNNKSSSTNQDLTQLFNAVLLAGSNDQNIKSFSDLPAGDMLKNIQQLFLPSPITMNQIKIIFDNSDNALKNYLASVRNIINKNYYNQINNTKATDSNYQNLIKANENTFNILKELPVPSSLATHHKNILETLLILKNIDNALNNDSDPVKRLIALKALDLLFQK